MSGATAVLVQPAEEPITVDDLKAHLRIDHDDEDAVLAGLISASRSVLETAMHRVFVTQTIRLVLDRFPPGRWIEIRRPPVQSIVQVEYVDSTGVPAVMPASEYELDAISSPARLALAPASLWPDTDLDRVNAVRVDFVAGYGAASLVLEPIKHAIRLLAGHWYENREATSDFVLRSAPFAVTALIQSQRWGAYPA